MFKSIFKKYKAALVCSVIFTIVYGVLVSLHDIAQNDSVSSYLDPTPRSEVNAALEQKIESKFVIPSQDINCNENDNWKWCFEELPSTVNEEITTERLLL